MFYDSTQRRQNMIAETNQRKANDAGTNNSLLFQRHSLGCFNCCCQGRHVPNSDCFLRFGVGSRSRSESNRHTLTEARRPSHDATPSAHHTTPHPNITPLPTQNCEVHRQIFLLSTPPPAPPLHPHHTTETQHNNATTKQLPQYQRKN